MNTPPASMGAVNPASSTETERLTRELAQVRAEFQDFVHTVSHDLRAPLRHIHAFSKILEEDLGNPPPDILGHLNTIRQAAQLLTQQLDGLTVLSRLGQQPLNLQAVPLAPLAQAVVDELVQRHPDRQVQWQVPQDLPQVLADADLLRQVFTHLLDNALKFSRSRAPTQVTLSWQVLSSQVAKQPADGTPAGQGVEPTANQGADQTPDHAESARQCQIRVTDNGVGFAPTQAHKLFKVFARLHPARDYDGMGLGLVICRKILERLGGCIDITAQPDAGCCVTVTLPMG
jgi:signal transduction histidine kinase